MNVCIIAQERAHEAAFMVGSQKKREQNAAQRSHVPRSLHRHSAPRATPRTVLLAAPRTVLRAARQKDGEARALPLFAFNLNAPMVALDDFAHHA